MKRASTEPTAPRVARHRLAIVAIVALLAVLPALAGAQGATPAPAGAPSALEAMLARVPAELPGLDDRAGAVIAFADLAAQLDAVGVERPQGREDPGFDAWIAATRGLTLPTSASPAGVYAREDYGFDLFQADQTFTIALPPFSLTLLRGEFDPDAVRGALESAGFRAVDVGGHELLALRGDNEMDLDAPRAFQMSAMNVAVILDDGTLAFASAGAPLAAVLDVAAGAAPSMLELSGVSELVAQAPPDLASAILVDGLDLGGGAPASMIDATGVPDIGAVATEVAARGELPPVVMALLGSTVGGPLEIDDVPVELPPGAPDARAIAVLLLPGAESAEAAAPVVEERLATGASIESGEAFATMFPERSVAAVPGAPVLVVDLTLGPGTSPRILVNLLFRRDLGFLVWW